VYFLVLCINCFTVQADAASMAPGYVALIVIPLVMLFIGIAVFVIFMRRCRRTKVFPFILVYIFMYCISN